MLPQILEDMDNAVTQKGLAMKRNLQAQQEHTNSKIASMRATVGATSAEFNRTLGKRDAMDRGYILLHN